MEEKKNGPVWIKVPCRQPLTQACSSFFRGGKPGLPTVTRTSTTRSGFGPNVSYSTPQRHPESKTGSHFPVSQGLVLDSVARS